MTSDAYAKAGVDQGAADSAVAGLVRALGAINLERPTAQVSCASAIEAPPRLTSPAARRVSTSASSGRRWP